VTLQPWFHEDRELIADQKIFQLYRSRARSPRTGQYRQFSVLQAPDWVNVVALTTEREVVLVRQFRHGTQEFTIEIPGGMIDRGESPAAAAIRELLEESGYAGGPAVQLGVVSPNPALFDNHCYTYLIEDCRKIREPELDHGEDIEVSTRPLAEIPGIIASGGIRHALVICAFWWLAQNAETPIASLRKLPLEEGSTGQF
jgi:ADP-ribose pyrophosphatase